MKDETRTLVISGERPPSWNEFYSGKHWSIRKQEADAVHAIVRSLLDPDQEPFKGRVDVSITVYAEKRPVDSDNICAKLYIDALKGWWFNDDTPDYIRTVSTQSEVDKEDPRTEIVVTQIENDFQYKCMCCDKCYPTKKMKVDHEKTMMGG